MLKSDWALAHKVEGLKPQHCFPIPIHELKLVATTAMILLITDTDVSPSGDALVRDA